MPTKKIDDYSQSERGVMAAFGSKVRELRIAKGLSQEKLAELTNVHRTYISGVERGCQNISLLTMTKLAQALSIALTELIPEE